MTLGDLITTTIITLYLIGALIFNLLYGNFITYCDNRTHMYWNRIIARILTGITLILAGVILNYIYEHWDLPLS